MNMLMNSMPAWAPSARLGRLLWVPAIVVMVALLSFYVQLLHQSVARGEALRLEQRAERPTARATPDRQRRDGRAVVARSIAVGAGR